VKLNPGLWRKRTALNTYKIAVVGTLGVKTFGTVPTKQILKKKISTAMAATQILA